MSLARVNSSEKIPKSATPKVSRGGEFCVGTAEVDFIQIFQTNGTDQAAKASVSTKRSKSARGICTVSPCGDETEKNVEGQRC
jgi:hypothetical protein